MSPRCSSRSRAGAIWSRQSTGRGFVVPAAELAAEKRTGKQVLNLRPGEEAALCVPADGDHVAVIGSNRKLLIFPLEQVPEMARGGGVILQRYRDGGLADAQGVPAGRRADLAAGREDAHRDQPARLDRRTRAGGATAAERVPAVGAVRLKSSGLAASRLCEEAKPTKQSPSSNARATGWGLLRRLRSSQ